MGLYVELSQRQSVGVGAVRTLVSGFDGGDIVEVNANLSFALGQLVRFQGCPDDGRYFLTESLGGQRYRVFPAPASGTVSGTAQSIAADPNVVSNAVISGVTDNGNGTSVITLSGAITTAVQRGDFAVFDAGFNRGGYVVSDADGQDITVFGSLTSGAPASGEVLDVNQGGYAYTLEDETSTNWADLVASAIVRPTGLSGTLAPGDFVSQSSAFRGDFATYVCHGLDTIIFSHDADTAPFELFALQSIITSTAPAGARAKLEGTVTSHDRLRFGDAGTDEFSAVSGCLVAGIGGDLNQVGMPALSFYGSGHFAGKGGEAAMRISSGNLVGSVAYGPVQFFQSAGSVVRAFYNYSDLSQMTMFTDVDVQNWTWGGAKIVGTMIAAGTVRAEGVYLADDFVQPGFLMVSSNLLFVNPQNDFDVSNIATVFGTSYIEKLYTFNPNFRRHTTSGIKGTAMSGLTVRIFEINETDSSETEVVGSPFTTNADGMVTTSGVELRRQRDDAVVGTTSYTHRVEFGGLGHVRDAVQHITMAAKIADVDWPVECATSDFEGEMSR